jgi:hypothetical protein
MSLNRDDLHLNLVPFAFPYNAGLPMINNHLPLIYKSILQAVFLV